MDGSNNRQEVNVSGIGNAVGTNAKTEVTINNYSNEPPLSDAERSACLAAYRERLLQETRFVSFAGLPTDATTARLRMPLEKIFIHVQLLTDKQSEEQKEHEREALLELEKQGGVGSKLAHYLRLGEYLFTRSRQSQNTRNHLSQNSQVNETIDAYAAYKEQRRLVFLGPPGAGKSTVLRYIAHKLLSENAPSVPILVRLRDYATIRASNASISLRDFALQEAAAGDPKLRRVLAEVQQPLWLLDALDEASGWRDQITHQANQLPGDLILTSRPLDYLPGALAALRHYELQALQLEDIEQFLRNWYAQLAELKAQPAAWIDERVSWIQTQLAARPGIQRLMSSPLLLTFLVLLAGDKPQVELPSQRADLYGRYIEQLFSTWEQQRQPQSGARGQRTICFGSLGPEASRRLALRSFEIIAWYLHLAYYDRPADYKPTHQALHTYLAQALKQEVAAQELQDIVKELLDFWQAAGLLLEWLLQGEIYLAFRHLTFQEYGVARQLASLWQYDHKQAWELLIVRLHIVHWREPLVMFGTLLPLPIRSDLAQKIWRAKSPYERSLWRDLRLLLLLWSEGMDLGKPLKNALEQRILGVLCVYPFTIFVVLERLYDYGGRLAPIIQRIFFASKNIKERADVYWWLFEANLRMLPTFTIDIFTTLLREPLEEVRLLAVEVLGRLGDEGSKDILKKVLNDKNSKVRKAAEAALRMSESKKAFELSSKVRKENKLSTKPVTWLEAVMHFAAYRR